MDDLRASLSRTEGQLREAERQAVGHADKAKQLAERLQSMERASRLSVSESVSGMVWTVVTWHVLDRWVNWGG